MTTITDVVQAGVAKGLREAFKCYPAIVETFNAEEQTITATIAIQQKVNGVDTTLPLLIDVK